MNYLGNPSHIAKIVNIIPNTKINKFKFLLNLLRILPSTIRYIPNIKDNIITKKPNYIPPPSFIILSCWSAIFVSCVTGIIVTFFFSFISNNKSIICCLL